MACKTRSTNSSGTKAKGIEVSVFNGSYLWSQDDIAKEDGTPYKVFTPYYRKGCMNATSPREPMAAPSLDLIDASEDSISINELSFYR